ncbi:LURP-one-related family protein [Lentisphaera marina]|uniref:LURP-one-related/scramblase family protein n=1 Tax=Lentisphaera marina TaxID=1111041 RepID=UPI00236582AE|nr:LURP-one-related family protein [Lentisphaera marina]MDD7984501.1 LURP-one-related family protein [Lentisphaera marina]
MKYIMKDKFFSLGDNYEIKTEDEKLAYTVKGKFLSFGNKLDVFDHSGKNVAFIEQKLLSMMPCYRLYKGGLMFAEVMQKFAWFKKNFLLDVPGPNDYTIKGDFWGHKYKFYRSGKVVARVDKKMFTWADSYGVDIVEGEDDLSIISTVIIIDLVSNNNSGSEF